MTTNIFMKKIEDIEAELKRIKKKYDVKAITIKRSKLLDLYGTWEGDVDIILKDLYRRRERKGRTDEWISS
jgi:hypothetical protein